MWIEGDEQARERASFGTRNDSAEEVAMADVHTVKRADGDHGAER
jgi:hypothetical protein